MTELLLGAIGMASLIAGALFARYWRTTRDRFFLFFAASFWLDGLDRFIIGAYLANYPNASEEQPLFYVIRLAAFMLILVAIAEKNRSHPGDRPRHQSVAPPPPEH